MRKMRTLLSLVLALAMLLTFMSIPTLAGATDGQVTIRFMTWESDTMNQAMLATFDKFMEDNPGIKVELEPSPLADYGIKLQEMLAAGIAPDIFMVGNDMALSYDANDLVLDLTPYMDADPDFADGFYPGVFTTYTQNGHLVGLPGLVNLYGIFYNKAFFDEAGIDYPAQGWTYDDMIAAAEALKKPEEQRYGLYQKDNSPFQTSVYSASKDGNGFCDNIYPVTAVQATDSFKEAIGVVSTAIQSGAITPPTYDDANVVGNFMQGAIPMMRYGQWAADEIIRNAPDTLDWGYAPYPRVDKDAQIIDAVGWCINAQTADPDAAFAVLKYLESETYKEVLVGTPVAAPAFMNAAEGYYGVLTEKGDPNMAANLEYMLNAEIKLPVRFLDPWAAKAQKFVDAEWPAIITGATDVNAVDTMVTEINEVIQNATK